MTDESSKKNNNPGLLLPQQKYACLLENHRTKKDVFQGKHPRNALNLNNFFLLVRLGPTEEGVVNLGEGVGPYSPGGQKPGGGDNTGGGGR